MQGGTVAMTNVSNSIDVFAVKIKLAQLRMEQYQKLIREACAIFAIDIRNMRQLMQLDKKNARKYLYWIEVYECNSMIVKAGEHRFKML